MIKVLWLVSWYPNESDPFSGDFIKRQAEAVSIYLPLKIVYVGKYAPKFYERGAEIKIVSINDERLKENILYYPDSGNNKDIISKIRSLLRFFWKHKEFIAQLQKNDDMPDIVHVQVAMKAGIIALYLKWKFKIPYVLTEHWSGYYQHSNDSLFKKSTAERYLTKLILKNASLLLPVSEALGNQISKYWMQVPYQKVPNVVDTRLFYPTERKATKAFRFIHISSLLYPKNPEGIVKVFVQMLQQKLDVELMLVGPMNSSVSRLLTDDIKSTGRINTTGEISYEQVGVELRKSDALVMFSGYENMPCVILEALCTGIPVIATRVGGIPEVISEDNGILITPGNNNELLEAMKKMIGNYQMFDKAKISQLATEMFSYTTIGEKIKEVYDSVLKKDVQI
jgi:glycosyltransferase involved in cell wall biosynthesis